MNVLSSWWWSGGHVFPRSPGEFTRVTGIYLMDRRLFPGKPVRITAVPQLSVRTFPPVRIVTVPPYRYFIMRPRQHIVDRSPVVFALCTSCFDFRHSGYCTGYCETFPRRVQPCSFCYKKKNYFY